MILADGVNWGPRSRLAARCAVRASMNYLNKHIFFPTCCCTTDSITTNVTPAIIASTKQQRNGSENDVIPKDGITETPKSFRTSEKAVKIHTSKLSEMATENIASARSY